MKRKLTILIIALILTLSACELTPTPTLEPEPTPAIEVEAPKVVEPEPEPEAVVPEEIGIKEDTAETESKPEAEEVEETEDVICVELLEPLDGIELPGNARVTFSWSAHPEADSYLLNFIFPDGLELYFSNDETTTARYMSGFSMHPAYNQSGEHQWNITALNAAGEELCQSDFFTFTKGLSDGVGEESVSQENGNNGNADNWVPPTPDPNG